MRKVDYLIDNCRKIRNPDENDKSVPDDIDHIIDRQFTELMIHGMSHDRPYNLVHVPITRN